MKISVEERRLVIEGRPLEYDAYYFDVGEYEGRTGIEVLKRLLAQWAKALSEAAPGRTLYLPFGFEDEYVECVEAEVAGEEVSLRHVWASENGYAVDVADLGPFLAASHEPHHGSPGRPLGVYGRDEFIRALLNPRVGGARTGGRARAGAGRRRLTPSRRG